MDSKNVNSITQQITEMTSRHLDLVIDQSDENIATAMRSFQSIVEKTKSVDVDIQGEIATIVEALQFHDRTKQILQSVQSSLATYRKAVKDLSDGKAVDLQQLKADLQSTFVVAEQFDDEEGQVNHVNPNDTHFF